MKMTIEKLKTAVAAIGFPEEALALGGHAEQAYCLEQDPDGKWEAYWRERGRKHELKRFDDEEAACYYMLGKLAYTQLISKKS